MGEPVWWTQERIDKVRGLAADGYSASQIAGVLGSSRNGVVGICHRKGIQLGVSTGGARPRKVAGPTGARRVTKRKVGRPYPIVRRKPVAAVAPPEAVEAIALPPEPVVVRRCEPVRFEDIAQHQCRWPIGDPVLDWDGFRMCGMDVEHSGPYCAEHTLRASSPYHRQLKQLIDKKALQIADAGR